MNQNEPDVVIIGGGVIGLFCAYYLSQEGKSVTILEKGSLKEACSYGNCGLISPSHALPLNSPELLMKSVKWLFQKDSPFYIRPQLDSKFISWMLAFGLNAFNKKQIERSMHGRNNLLMDSKNLYDKLFASQSFDCNWAPSGIHFVFSKEKSFEGYRIKDTKLSAIGLNAEPIIGQQLMDMEPALTDHAYGSWFYKIDASLNPGKLLTELRKQLLSNGVVIEELCEVKEFKKSNNRITELVTNKGNFKAENVVLAAGAWSPWLENQLNLKIPIVPGKGYSITMKRPALSPICPLIFEERKVVATPWKDSYRLGGTMEFAGYNDKLDHSRLQGLKRAATEYLKEPFTEENTEEWCGWRPMTSDGMPIIDQSPKHNNLYLACGHNMLGLSMAPSTGKLITEMITGKEPHLDHSLYSFNRF